MRALLMLMVFALPVAADPSPAADVDKMSTDDCARARKLKKTCVLSIEGTDVAAERPASTDSLLSIIPFIGQDSMIRIRRDFIPEILKTAEDL